MNNLLGYLKGYEHGGSVDVDPWADTSQQDVLDKLNIDIYSGAMGLLPTYDPTGANLMREEYSLGESSRRHGAQQDLLGMTQAASQGQAQSGFSTSGANIEALSNTREDISRGFGQAAREAELGLRQDIYSDRQRYERELTSGIGDLDPDDYTIGNRNFFEGEEFNIVESLPPSGTMGQTVGYGGTFWVWAGASWHNTGREY